MSAKLYLPPYGTFLSLKMSVVCTLLTANFSVLVLVSALFASALCLGCFYRHYGA